MFYCIYVTVIHCSQKLHQKALGSAQRMQTSVLEGRVVIT